MSQHGLPLDDDEPWVSDALDLSIKTLTGTTFEIRVSPDDTIMSIKAKIQRVEGIPIAQQHLLYNLAELHNSAAVKDYSIPNGAVLKLVLSMRGGPISTRRLPPADEALWREVQEWMTDGRRDDQAEQSSSAAKTSIVVFRDGNSVNLFRVVENDDGTYSPLSQSPTTPSLKDRIAKDDLLGFGKRMMENWVTMGKMQELKGKLEKLSITKKDKKPGEDNEVTEDQQQSSLIADKTSRILNVAQIEHNSMNGSTPDARMHSDSMELTGSKPCKYMNSFRIHSQDSQDSSTASDGLSGRSVNVPPIVSYGRYDSSADADLQRQYLTTAGDTSSISRCGNLTYMDSYSRSENSKDSEQGSAGDLSSSRAVGLPCMDSFTRYGSGTSPTTSHTNYPKPIRGLAVNEGASCSGLSSPLKEGMLQPTRLKARKDADNIIRLQSKSLSVVVDGHGYGSLKRAPLPDIKRSLRTDRLPLDDNPLEDKSELRGKTGSRMPMSTFAILEEESDVGPSSSICSSASSLVALPSNNDVVVAYSPMSREHGSAIGSRSFRLSRYVLGNAERPKTAPSVEKTKSDRSEYDVANENRNENLMNHVMCSTVELAPSWYSSKSRLEMRDRSEQKQHKDTEPRYMEQLRVVTQRSSNRPSEPPPPPPIPVPAPLTTKKPRCLVCKKRLNITNTHTCRCEGVFCSTHRYSETHDCHFDYKVEGKHLLRLANPLVIAPKLPKL